MALGTGKSEHSGPRDMSRKCGHWGLTEEAKEWASRARRRDEAVALRHEESEHAGQSDAVDGLTELWLKRWPGSRPIGHELHQRFPERWVRFHSLPESKRYADTEDEYAELLHRHHVVIDELQATRRRGDELLVVTVEWSINDQLEPRPAELEEAFPSEPWTNVLRERDGDDEYWTHLFIGHTASDAPAFDRLLRSVADHDTSDVIIADLALNWLYHPYNGGADVIASSNEERGRLRAAHPDWLSTHPQGL